MQFGWVVQIWFKGLQSAAQDKNAKRPRAEDEIWRVALTTSTGRGRSLNWKTRMDLVIEAETGKKER